MINRLIVLCLLMAALSIGGCGSGGGSIGDENDPSETTDVDMMADETGNLD